MDKITRQKIVMALDVIGYEQDGDTLEFINIAGDGSRKVFGNWDEAYDFVIDWAKKNGI